jgi:hypothetical protein
MSDTNTQTQATLETAAAPTYKMSIADTVKMLQNYLTQADNSLAQLQNNIDSATNQVNEWKRIQLMIVGQKQLIADIISKTVDTPAPPKSEVKVEAKPQGNDETK